MRDTRTTKDVLGFLKLVGGGVLGVIGFATSVMGFVKLLNENTGITTLGLLLIGASGILTVLLYVALKKESETGSIILHPTELTERRQSWSYSDKTRTRAMKAAVLVSVTMATLVLGWLINRFALPRERFIVVVAQFAGPDKDRYRVTDIVAERLREATKGFPETEVLVIGESLTEQQGPQGARLIGESQNASVVLWGWYGKSSEVVVVTVHFEVLRGPKHQLLETQESMSRTSLAQIETFDAQIRLSDEVSYLTLLLTGLIKYERRDYQGAIERFTNALSSTPAPQEMVNPAALYFYRGNALFFKENFSDAIADYNTAIALKPDYVKYYYNRGGAFVKQAELELAIADFAKSIELDPNYAQAYINRGDVFASMQNYSNAVLDYDEAIRLRPDFAKAYINRGGALAGEHEYDRAIADYNQALAISPMYAKAYNKRGIAYTKKGRYDQALSDFNRALSIKRNYARAYNNRGLMYSDEGEYKLAIADFNKAIALKFIYPEAYRNRGSAYAALKDYDKAIQDFVQAIDQKPSYAEAYYDCGDAYANKGDQDNAKLYNTKAARLVNHSNRHDVRENEMESLEDIKTNN